MKINTDILFDAVMNTSDDSDIGYMGEVDLSFPKALHELLQQFVPCPENTIPKTKWFSEYQKELQALTHDNTKTHNLIAHLYDRKNYTLHYRTLKFL